MATSGQQGATETTGPLGGVPAGKAAGGVRVTVGAAEPEGAVGGVPVAGAGGMVGAVVPALGGVVAMRVNLTFVILLMKRCGPGRVKGVRQVHAEPRIKRVVVKPVAPHKRQQKKLAALSF